MNDKLMWNGPGLHPPSEPKPEFWELYKKVKAMVTKPTYDDIREELLESVHREIDDSWRHGNYVYEVFHRESDDTYWAVNYNESGDGEYNSLRDEREQFTQVTPVKKMVEVTEYVAVKEGNDGKTDSSTGKD